MEKQEMQQEVLMYQLLQKHLESLKQRGALLENRMLEAQSAKESVKDLEKTKAADMLVPLGAGCYTAGKTTDAGKMLISVGAGVLIKQDIKGTLEFLESQEKELEKAGKALQQEVEEATKQLTAVTSKIEARSHGGHSH